MVYDWRDKEWVRSGPDVPHPLEEHDRLLVRSLTLSDDDCMDLHTFLREDKLNKATSIAPGRSRKRSHSKMLHNAKDVGTALTVKPELPGPSTLKISPPRSPVDMDIDLPPPPKKARRLNAESLSWIMRQTYGTVSHGLDRVYRLRHNSYELLEAVDTAFKAVRLSRSTWQRHDALYQRAPQKLKSEWAAVHSDRPWAEFWQECSGAEADEPGVESSEDDEKIETKQELLPRLKKEGSAAPLAIRTPSILELSSSSSDAPISPSDRKKRKKASHSNHQKKRTGPIEVIELSD